jgi:acetoin utilization protein AcuB
MKVDDIMSTRLVTVEMDDRLETALRIFSNAPLHHLLVIEEGRLVGVVSDRDLYRAISPNINTAAETDKDRATLHKYIHQIMSREPIFLSSGASLDEAITILAERPISCIPIVGAQRHPVGIISWRDILRAIKDHQLLGVQTTKP